MELTDKLKKRFCKDYNLSIQLFEEPYFTDRVRLLGKEDKLKEFKELLNKYNTDEEFLEYNNKVRDSIIDYIKQSSAYQALNSDDMNKYAIPEKYRNYSKTDVYKSHNVGNYFISVDLVKANFSALVYYAKATGTQFFDTYDWSEFMHQCTDVGYFVDSKYIRQVVLGNCNPKGQIGYESYMITKWLEALENEVGAIEINSIHSDEVVLRTSRLCIGDIMDIKKYADEADIPLKVEYFRLAKITNSDAYVKYIYDLAHGGICDREVKCIQPWEAPAIYRMLNGEVPFDDDLYFDFNGRLAKFEAVTEYEVVF